MLMKPRVAVEHDQRNSSTSEINGWSTDFERRFQLFRLEYTEIWLERLRVLDIDRKAGDQQGVERVEEHQADGHCQEQGWRAPQYSARGPATAVLPSRLEGLQVRVQALPLCRCAFHLPDIDFLTDAKEVRARHMELEFRCDRMACRLFHWAAWTRLNRYRDGNPWDRCMNACEGDLIEGDFLFAVHKRMIAVSNR